MITEFRPSCWYSWNGIEQNVNAMQTNRAICVLYTLTGDYDTQGGNLVLPRVPSNAIDGREYLSKEAIDRRLGLKEKPLGTAGTMGAVQAYDVYKAILTGIPYSVKALIGFGGNLITSNTPVPEGREALCKLELHVQTELFLSPTAQLADYVLPAASHWESWHLGLINVSPMGSHYLQLRPAVVPPQYESRPDMEIIFTLANRLGIGERFWSGNVEDGMNFQYAPTGFDVEEMKQYPGGISLDIPVEYRKYRKKDESGNYIGFPTPSRRVEIYSQTFKDHGYDPLPEWKQPVFKKLVRDKTQDKYPLILTGSRVKEYCHSEHRALPSLRKAVPHPFLEINRGKAREIGCKDGDTVILESPYRSITLKAKVVDSIAYNVVCTQDGWWQECVELGLPGYNAFSSEGANVSFVYENEEKDEISGCLPLKAYPCNVRVKR
jgi:anaerobic selenocysteine-containing dehydrogenase